VCPSPPPTPPAPQRHRSALPTYPRTSRTPPRLRPHLRPNPPTPLYHIPLPPPQPPYPSRTARHPPPHPANLGPVGQRVRVKPFGQRLGPWGAKTRRDRGSGSSRFENRVSTPVERYKNGSGRIGASSSGGRPSVLRTWASTPIRVWPAFFASRAPTAVSFDEEEVVRPPVTLRHVEFAHSHADPRRQVQVAHVLDHPPATVRAASISSRAASSGRGGVMGGGCTRVWYPISARPCRGPPLKAGDQPGDRAGVVGRLGRERVVHNQLIRFDSLSPVVNLRAEVPAPVGPFGLVAVPIIWDCVRAPCASPERKTCPRQPRPQPQDRSRQDGTSPGRPHAGVQCRPTRANHRRPRRSRCPHCLGIPTQRKWFLSFLLPFSQMQGSASRLSAIGRDSAAIDTAPVLDELLGPHFSDPGSLAREIDGFVHLYSQLVNETPTLTDDDARRALRLANAVRSRLLSAVARNRRPHGTSRPLGNSFSHS